MKSLRINYGIFFLAFARDVDYHDVYPKSFYLHRAYGLIVEVYDEDRHASMQDGTPPEENEEARNDIAKSPEKYLEIPGLSHGDHHDILQGFLDSDWTDDKSRREKAKDAYHRSIGRWRKTVDDDDAVSAYLKFSDKRIEELAKEFLRKHGIEPKWC